MKAFESHQPTQRVFFMRGLLQLCPREWDVLMLIAEDDSNEAIADKLYLQPKSAENYRTRIGKKLQLTGVGKLAQFATQYRTELRFWYEESTGKFPPPDNS